MSFCFRLRFQMVTGLTAGRQHAVQLPISGIAHPIEVAAEFGTLEEATWFACTSCGYPSEEEARANGERLRTAFTLAGVINRLGVDFGYDNKTFQFGQFISDAHRKATGRELRGSVHGLDVFDKDNVTVPVASVPKFRAINSAEALQKGIQDAMNMCAELSERQQICASLINDSLFVQNLDVRFVMCVSAVEALCDQGDVSNSYRSLIDNVLTWLSELQGFETEKQTLSKLLRNQKGKSVRDAYRSKITGLLTPKKAKRFAKLYGLRSNYVHDGKGRGKVGKHSDEILNIAVELLKADIRSANPTQ
jgi:Apea-like HEPN